MRNIHAQSASPFFNKLPLEIRRQIYSKAIGGEEIRFRVANELETSSGGGRPDTKLPFKLTCSGARKVMGFPTSCKLAYLEATSYIYTSNTFQFSGTTSFWCFKRLLPSQNLALIQSLHLQYTYGAAYSSRDMIYGPAPWGRETWQTTCNEISSLKKIRHLRLDFVFWAIGVDAAQEDIFYGGLKCLRKGTKVEVRVPWPQRRAMQAENVFTFKLTREVNFQEGNEGWFAMSNAEVEEMPGIA